MDSKLKISKSSNKHLKSKIIDNKSSSKSKSKHRKKDKSKSSKKDELKNNASVNDKDNNSKNKGFVFDFENSIIDKLKDQSRKFDKNDKSGWNYSKVINEEKLLGMKRHNKFSETNNSDNNQKNDILDEDVFSENSEDEKNVWDKEAENRFENDIFAKDLSFNEFNLSKLILKSCSDLNFFHPTKVQAKVIPLILEKTDVLVNAETGSGKTACYLLPILQNIIKSKSHRKPYKVLLLIPTRELALQCSQMLSSLIKYTDVTYVTVVGGMDIENQTSKLKNQPDIIIATPGRLIDMIYNYKSIELTYINCLVLDEADKLLELGFKDAIIEILNKMGAYNYSKSNDFNNSNSNQNSSIQVLMFSATLNPKVIDLGNKVLKNPVKLKLEHSSLLANLKQSIVRMKFKNSSNTSIENDETLEDENEEKVEKKKISNKFNSKIKNKEKSKKKKLKPSMMDLEKEFNQRMSYLICILKELKLKRSIIFFNSKVECHKAQIVLSENKFKCGEMHSDIHQSNRVLSLENFQNGTVDFLLATDVAGRGIDVEKVRCVINFQMPLEEDRYIHRIGRTARKGYMGQAITICNDTDRIAFKKLMRKQKFELTPLKIDTEQIKKTYKDLLKKASIIKEKLSIDSTEKDLLLAEMKLEKSYNTSENWNNISNKPKK